MSTFYVYSNEFCELPVYFFRISDDIYDDLAASGGEMYASQRTVDDVMRPAPKIDGHDLRRTVASTRRFTTIKHHIGFQSGTQTHTYYNSVIRRRHGR